MIKENERHNHKAYKEGQEAFEEHKSFSDNPYMKVDLGDIAPWVWAEGFIDAIGLRVRQCGTAVDS